MNHILILMALFMVEAISSVPEIAIDKPATSPKANRF